MNYVVLHIDLEFIVGVVCSTDNASSYPITNGNDDLLWLYFYNDARTNRITFGKNNRNNANKEVTNYYGKFFNIITDGHTTFKRGEFQKEAIELLQYSDLLKTIKDKYASTSKESAENVPTLITFSLSISDWAKQKTVEYLKTQGFQIESYTIPLSELVGYYPFSKKDFLPASGSPILLLAATNATLYIMKLVFSNTYFMLDGEVRKYEGMGIDPRKRALVGFVVNEINKSVGALNVNEIPAEIEKKEFKADEWLRKIDAKAKNDNSPVRITDSLSPMPSSMHDVLVRKSDIEIFTNDFVNVLMDYFNAYKSDNISGDIAGIFLLGNCFNNSLVKQRFNNLFRDGDERKKKLFAYTNKDIQNILSVYPKIDFRRYISEEERSKAKAEVEQQKIAEQLAIDAAKETEAKAEKAKIEAEKKLEGNRKKAETLYARAVELDKEGKLQDALVNVENALDLDSDNVLYKELLNKIKDKQNELRLRQEQYKLLIKKAEKHLENGELESALNVFELAKEIDDNAVVANNILETKAKIKKQKRQQEEVKNLLTNAEKLLYQEKLSEAKVEFGKVLQIESNHIEAKAKIKEIDSILQMIEIKFDTLVKTADSNVEIKMFDAAINTYNEALKLKPNDEFCLKQIKAVKEKKKSLTPPAPPRPTASKPTVSTTPIAPPAPASHNNQQVPEPYPTVTKLIKEKRTVAAVAELKKITGWGQKECVDWVDNWQAALPTKPTVPTSNGGKASPPPPPPVVVPKKDNSVPPLTPQKSNSGKGMPPPPPPPPRPKKK
jgi:tetratricopeptide (TPR) repeat protein